MSVIIQPCNFGLNILMCPPVLHATSRKEIKQQNVKLTASSKMQLKIKLYE